jgi:hypothetical protein
MMPLAIGPTSLDWPAWVQAVGSVAAIAVTAWLARRDGHVRKLEREQDRVERLSLQAKSDEKAEREPFERDARFIYFVTQEIGFSDRSLVNISEQMLIYQTDEVGPNTNPYDLLVDIDRKLEDGVLRRLKRIADLPATMWPNPNMASLFFSDFRVIERDIEALGELFKVKFAPNKEADWSRFDDVALKVHKMASLIDMRFTILRRLSKYYVNTAISSNYEFNYPFWTDVINDMTNEWEADELRRLGPMPSREEMEEEYDRLCEEHGQYNGEEPDQSFDHTAQKYNRKG